MELPRKSKQALEQFASRLREEFGPRCHQLILYGSHARGEGTQDSDIDVLVVLDPTEDSVADWDRCIDIAADIGSHTGELISVLTSLSGLLYPIWM